jgi:hypothetical protein
MPTRGPITTPAIQVLLFEPVTGAILVATGDGTVLAEVAGEEVVMVEDAVVEGVGEELVPMNSSIQKSWALETWKLTTCGSLIRTDNVNRGR